MAACYGGGQNKQAATTIAEDDDLFEIDIDLLGRCEDDVVVNDGHPRCRGSHCAAAAVTTDGDDGSGHALLANCLMPVSSVSSAVPVLPATTTSYPYSGYYYYSPRRLFTGGSSKRFLFGRSARFCFSSRGFETMGNYFQRY